MKIDPNYIIWIGSVFSDECVYENIAISPAANKWQLNFINALKSKGNRILNVGHYPQRAFPKGKLLVNKRESLLPNGINFVNHSYLNFPLFRIILLNVLYTKLLIEQFSSSKDYPKYVISYNTYNYTILPLLYVKYVKRIKWVSLVADPINNKTHKIHPVNFIADGNVFLSWSLFRLSKLKVKYFLDGGINNVFVINPLVLKNKEKYILYTGAIDYYTGVELLIESFELLKNKSMKLVICGKGVNNILTKKLNQIEGITYLGMVDELKLRELYDGAFAFINPRLTANKTNESNFPSKILEYLAYCKPIISTYTSGMHPDYKKIINFVYNDSPSELANMIDEVAAYDDVKYMSLCKSICKYDKKYKIWEKQISMFEEWIETIK